jgi:hypothetical protein
MLKKKRSNGIDPNNPFLDVPDFVFIKYMVYCLPQLAWDINYVVVCL